MALLQTADKDLFDGFIKWRKDAVGYISEENRALVHLVLFGIFGDKDIHRVHPVCRKYDCENCKMYTATRCHDFVKSKYSALPSLMREIMNNAYASSDYEFYKRTIEDNFDKRKTTELILIVGSYRYELFLEEMHNRAIKSAMHHNKLNKDKEVTVFKDKDPKYYSLDYIKENDFWSMYKETQLEGDLLCSILSDF